MAGPTHLDLLLELASLLERHQEISLKRAGLTEARAHVLWALRDGPVTQRRLADALRVTARNITGLVDALTESGHVVRRRHPTDRRATLVDLTPEGRRLVDHMVEGYGELHEALLGHLSERQLAMLRKTLTGVLQRLRTRLEELEG